MAGPFHDTMGRHTAYMQGQSDYINNLSMNAARHNIGDAYRTNLYNEGWSTECVDHMDVVPAPSAKWLSSKGEC